MNVPPWAGFVADFSDDQVATADDVQVFGGRNVALAVGEILASLGCSRVSPPASAGEEGWEFSFYYEDRYRIWCRIQSFHPVFWMLFEDASASKNGAAAYAKLWRKFGNALEADPRFHKILWRSLKDGPPDWDEVEAAADPPERTFEEEYPPSEIVPKKLPLGCWPILVWVWFTLSGVSEIAVGMNSRNRKERVEDIAIGSILLILCLTPVVATIIEAIRRRRKA
jgi:hypothetical protein